MGICALIPSPLAAPVSPGTEPSSVSAVSRGPGTVLRTSHLLSLMLNCLLWGFSFALPIFQVRKVGFREAK